MFVLIAGGGRTGAQLASLLVAQNLDSTIDDGLAMERKAFVDVVRTEDALEGIQAFFQKREPEFKGR